MDDVIGREVELKKLEKLLNSSEGELLAIYGRRRIGKTFLINQFFQNKGIYFELSGISGEKAHVQLGRFPQAIRKAFANPQYRKVPKDWFEAFEFLEEEVNKIDEKEQVIIFLDELPWLASLKSKLIKAFEHSWNTYFSRRKNLVVILCGSAAAWMIKKVINNRAGLYGRLTEIIHLQPFRLYETEKFLQKRGIQLSREQIVDLYMVTGGIAKYLNFIQKGLSAAQNIQEMCFSTNGFLTIEFQNLFVSLFDDSEKHMEIIQVLAKHKGGLTLTQLSSKLQPQPSGHLSTKLVELEAAGFIHGIPFFGKKKKDRRYTIADEYVLFYLTWIEPGFFSQNRHISSDYWLSQFRDPKFLAWGGYAFENICYKHIQQIIHALQLSVIAKSSSHWSCRANPDLGVMHGAQVDLVIDRKDKCINLCEIKFTNSPFVLTKEYAQKLNQKREIFSQMTGVNKSLFTTLIVAKGVEKNSAYFSSVDQTIDLDALFK